MLCTGGTGLVWYLWYSVGWGPFGTRSLGSLTPGRAWSWLWLIVIWIIQLAFPEGFIFQRICRGITMLPEDPLLLSYNSRQQERGGKCYARQTHIHLKPSAIGNEYNRMFGGNEVSLDPEFWRRYSVPYLMLGMPVTYQTNKKRAGLLLLDAIPNVNGTEADAIRW